MSLGIPTIRNLFTIQFTLRPNCPSNSKPCFTGYLLQIIFLIKADCRHQSWPDRATASVIGNTSCDLHLTLSKIPIILDSIRSSIHITTTNNIKLEIRVLLSVLLSIFPYQNRRIDSAKRSWLCDGILINSTFHSAGYESISVIILSGSSFQIHTEDYNFI